MRVGIHAPQLGRAANPALLIEVARLAEDAGYADLWFSDHVAVPTGSGMPSFFPEPVPLMALAAGHTERIGLGTSVLIPAYRNPMHLAKQWATLDWVAPGRTILGVGAGWLDAEFAACGIDPRRKGDRLDDYLAGWRALWAGEDAHEGEFFAFSGVRVRPQPRERIRIWVGGSSPGALRRAARCDGWHPTQAPVAVFAERLAALRAEIAAAGRTPPDVTVSMHVEVRLGDPARAGYWSEAGDHHPDAAGLSGSPDDVAAALDGYAEAGLEHVVLTPQCRDEQEWRRSVEGLAELIGQV